MAVVQVVVQVARADSVLLYLELEAAWGQITRCAACDS